MRLTPLSLCAPLAVPSGFFGCTIFGSLGAFVPDTPGDPVYDLLPLSLPMAMCGDVTDAILPELVAPAVAYSLTITSLILINSIYQPVIMVVFDELPWITKFDRITAFLPAIP